MNYGFIFLSHILIRKDTMNKISSKKGHTDFSKKKNQFWFHLPALPILSASYSLFFDRPMTLSWLLLPHRPFLRLCGGCENVPANLQLQGANWPQTSTNFSLKFIATLTPGPGFPQELPANHMRSRNDITAGLPEPFFPPCSLKVRLRLWFDTFLSFSWLKNHCVFLTDFSSVKSYTQSYLGYLPSRRP